MKSPTASPTESPTESPTASPRSSSTLVPTVATTPPQSPIFAPLSSIAMDEPIDNDPVVVDTPSDDDPMNMNALTYYNPVVTPEELQLSIDQLINGLCDWTATLPFTHIEGISEGEEIDLFSHVAETTTKTSPYTLEVDFDPIRFDRSKYPPTKDGLWLLSTELKRIAWFHGTQLITRHTGLTFNCSRCPISSKQKKIQTPPPNRRSRRCKRCRV
jgi:hypothetical protein